MTIFRIHVHKHKFFHGKFWKINNLWPYIGKPKTTFHHFSINCHYSRLVHSKPCICSRSVILQYLMWPLPAAPLHAAQSLWFCSCWVLSIPAEGLDWVDGHRQAEGHGCKCWEPASLRLMRYNLLMIMDLLRPLAFNEEDCKGEMTMKITSFSLL